MHDRLGQSIIITMETAVATTDQRLPRPGPKDGLTNATRVMTEEQLTKRHRLMIDYMVHGVAHTSILERLPKRYVPAGLDAEGAPLQKLGLPELHEPLTAEDAATACNLRPRVARQLLKQRVFTRLLSEETEAFRNGAKARAVRRIDALAHDPGAGKAADRKVQLAASQALIGEGDRGKGATVNVYNGGQHLTAGIVIMRRSERDGLPRPIEHGAAA